MWPLKWIFVVIFAAGSVAFALGPRLPDPEGLSTLPLLALNFFAAILVVRELGLVRRRQESRRETGLRVASALLLITGIAVSLSAMPWE